MARANLVLILPDMARAGSGRDQVDAVSATDTRSVGVKPKPQAIHRRRDALNGRTISLGPHSQVTVGHKLNSAASP